jgi:hypothetical protein
MSSVEEFYAGAGEKSSASSIFNNQNRAMVCLLGVGLGHVIPQEHKHALIAIRGLHFAFYFCSMLIYRRAISNIDNTYTSFTSKNDFGMSNTEKAAARISAKSTINTMLWRGAISFFVHWRSTYIIPIVVSIAFDICNLVGNESFYAVITNRPLKKPHNIPRSQSGRLI